MANQLEVNRGTGRTTRMRARVREAVGAGKQVLVLATDPVWGMVVRDLDLGGDITPLGDGSWQFENGAQVRRGYSMPDPTTGKSQMGRDLVVIADHFWLEQNYQWVLNEWFRDQP